MSKATITSNEIYLGTSKLAKFKIGAGHAICIQTFSDGTVRSIEFSTILTDWSSEPPYASIALEALSQLDIGTGTINVFAAHENFVTTMNDWCLEWEQRGWKTAANKEPKNSDVLTPLWALTKTQNVKYATPKNPSAVAYCKAAQTIAKGHCDRTAANFLAG